MTKISGTSWTNASAVMLAVVLCLAAGSAAAQNLNPAYLKELPSVDRVMNDMKKTSYPAEISFPLPAIRLRSSAARAPWRATSFPPSTSNFGLDFFTRV